MAVAFGLLFNYNTTVIKREKSRKNYAQPRPPLPTRLPFSLSLLSLLSLLLRRCGRRRRPPLQVLRLALKLAPVLQLHDAPSGAGVEPRHDAPLPVELLHLEAVQLDASADGNGRGRRGRGGGW